MCIILKECLLIFFAYKNCIICLFVIDLELIYIYIGIVTYIILDTSLLSNAWLADIFLSFYGLVFHFPDDIVDSMDHFNFKEV